jgi:Leucine-rich repeat (LRR) protein
MSEFRINDFIMLKLEDGKTNIYIFGKEFIQCKYLLMNIPVQSIEQYDGITSIDEAAEKLDKSLDLGNPEGYQLRKELPAEVEFWGHCSNLQVWSEQDYDTRILVKNIAFPLLKKLTEVGDPKAERIFKSEIGKRFEMGPDSVRQYLALEGYMNYLSREELWSVIPNQTEVRILRTIEKEVGAEFKLCSNEMGEYLWGDKPNQLAFSIKEDCVNEIDFLNFITLSALKWEKIFALLGKLTNLKWLYLSHNNLKTIPHSVGSIKGLEVLKLDHNGLEELREEIGNLEKLRWLILNDNKISTLPRSIGKLQLLKELQVNRNRLIKIPNSIGNLKSLIKLFLKNNSLENLPDAITGMKSLRQLDLSDNCLSDLPKKITEMKSLKGIGLKGNKINESSPIIDILEKKGVIILL